MSFSRTGQCWDNAVAESFFATLKDELIYRRAWPTRQAARAAIFEFIEVFYNRQRLHSALGYLSPADYETIRHTEPAWDPRVLLTLETRMEHGKHWRAAEAAEVPGRVA